MAITDFSVITKNVSLINNSASTNNSYLEKENLLSYHDKSHGNSHWNELVSARSTPLRNKRSADQKTHPIKFVSQDIPTE